MKNDRIASRQELKDAFTQVLMEKMQTLSPKMQTILVDDLVTAFENRLKILQKLEHKTDMQLLIANVEQYELVRS